MVVLESVSHAFLDGLLGSVSSCVSQGPLSPASAIDLRIELLQIRYKLHTDFKWVHGTKHGNMKMSMRSKSHDSPLAENFW